MAAVDISIDVGALLGVSLAVLSPSAGEALVDALEDVRGDWDEELLGYWPIDTGFSLGNWESSVEGLRLVLRNAVEYSEYVHPSGQDVGDGVRHMTDVRDRLVGAALPGMRLIIEADRSRRVTLARPEPVPQSQVFQAAVEAFGRRSGSIRRLEPPRLLSQRALARTLSR